jgi:hypothetical protein
MMILALLYLLGEQTSTTAPDDYAQASAVSAMFDATQGSWTRIFASGAKRYVDAEMVLFRDAVDSGCGPSQPAMGSFYCPLDRRVYVDLGVYRELRRRFATAADLAMAYILAHEVAHHVQTLLSGERSTRSELQADCLAGVSWHATAHGARGRAELENAVKAAITVGAHDSSEVLTHGSPAQRVNSFRSGFESGQISVCLK